MRLTLLIAALLLAGFGCAPAPSQTTDDRPQTTAPASDEAPLAATVTIRGFSFAPPDIRVKAGGTVTWTNDHGAAHVISADNGTFESPRLAKGQTFTQTFTETGSFSYHCSVHPAMKGTVVVE